jgi:hypothetical protein
MSLLIVPLEQLPFVAGAFALAVIALVGWRRTRLTGLLLIAIAGGISGLHRLATIYELYTLPRHGRFGTWTVAYNLAQWLGGVVAETLLVVGVALVIRRLRATPRA